MALLMEEVLVGIEQAKDGLEGAVATLQDIVEDLSPELEETSNIGTVLSEGFLKPLQERYDAMSELLEQLALIE
jgi:hypothetical protein